MKGRAVMLLAGVLLALTGCAASYQERMKHLDDVTSKGLAYRAQLERQGTAPSEKACMIGWELLKDDPPTDRDAAAATDEWRDQVKEAYVKACMTGGARPKPDPGGIKAVTPVPHASSAPR